LSVRTVALRVGRSEKPYHWCVQRCCEMQRSRIAGNDRSRVLQRVRELAQIRRRRDAPDLLGQLLFVRSLDDHDVALSDSAGELAEAARRPLLLGSSSAGHEDDTSVQFTNLAR